MRQVGLIPKPYPLLVECIENAAGFVWRRAFKHDETVPELTDLQMERLEDAICEEVLNQICDRFDIVDMSDVMRDQEDTHDQA